MSDTKPKEWTKEELLAARLRCASAMQMVSDLCQPRGTERHRDWVMSIPVREDVDPDVVISVALRDGRKALGEIERLQKLAVELARELKDLVGLAVHVNERDSCSMKLDRQQALLTRPEVAALLKEPQ